MKRAKPERWYAPEAPSCRWPPPSARVLRLTAVDAHRSTLLPLPPVQVSHDGTRVTSKGRTMYSHAPPVHRQLEARNRALDDTLSRCSSSRRVQSPAQHGALRCPLNRSMWLHDAGTLSKVKGDEMHSGSAQWDRFIGARKHRAHGM